MGRPGSGDVEREASSEQVDECMYHSTTSRDTLRERWTLSRQSTEEESKLGLALQHRLDSRRTGARKGGCSMRKKAAQRGVSQGPWESRF